MVISAIEVILLIGMLPIDILQFGALTQLATCCVTGYHTLPVIYRQNGSYSFDNY